MNAQPASFETLESRRLLSAGDLDPTFGVNGEVAFDPAGPRVNSVSVLPDDRLLVIASNTTDANLPYVLRRYTAAGQLDTTFGGGDGQVEFAVQTNLPPGYSNTGASVTPLSDGKILVSASITQTVPGEDNIPTPYLERLNSDGTVDSTFGDGGVVKLFSSTSLNSLVIQDDDKILMLCTSAPTGEGPIVLRRNSDGSPDTSFGGGDAEVSFPRGAMGDNPIQLQWQSDGKILGIGYNSGEGTPIFVQRLNGDGSSDTSFANQGEAIVDIPGVMDEYPFDSVLLDNGKLRIGITYEKGPPGGLIYGLDADGTLDTSFGNNGVNVTDFGFGQLSADAQGRLLIFGSANTDVPTNGQLAIARLDATTGRIDESFGRVLLGDGHTIAFAQQQGFALQSDGAVIILAKALDPAVQPVVTHSEMRRLLPGGSDPSPVALASGTLAITGGAGDDYILAKPGDTTGGQTPTTVASVSGFGRVFDAADVSLISVLANAGGDTIDLSAIALPSTVSGGAGDDRIAGGAGDDSISGGDGRDWIDGRDGNDSLAGDAGHDKLNGGEGNDTLHGGTGPDGLIGWNGNDQIFGNNGDDYLDGSAGSDTLQGNAGHDTIIGSAGADRLDGGDGNDSIEGQGGNDRISGGEGIDTMNGGAGNDTFLTSGDHAIDQIAGDRGEDWAVCDDTDILVGIEHSIL